MKNAAVKNESVLLDEQIPDGIGLSRVKCYMRQILAKPWKHLQWRRRKADAGKAYGYYRRIHDRDVLDASFGPTADGRWYGKLRLNNWMVKEHYTETPEQIRDWCFHAFMELHVVGYDERETAAEAPQGACRILS